MTQQRSGNLCLEVLLGPRQRNGIELNWLHGDRPDWNQPDDVTAIRDALEDGKCNGSW